MPTDTEYFLRRKRLLPSELRTREWDAAHRAALGTPNAATLGWCTERAFFMAAVTRAEQLQAFRNTAAAVAAGRMGPAEARQAMRQTLASMGYQARPGQQGTIKDLAATPRLKVAIDTNVELARGWAQHQTSLQNYVRPAQMLYRAGEAKAPRDWLTRWNEAAAAVGGEGVSPTTPFIALKTSPIWRALSRFDQPYPPFDFGSHMRTRSISLEEAQAAGLLTDDADLAAVRAKQRRAALASMNESVECTPDVADRTLREQLANVLQGLAEWQGNRLVMTDPNGTKPYPPEEIGRIITAPLPHGFEHRQVKAFREWVQDSGRFEGHPPEVGMDKVEDVQRLFSRIESKRSETPLYRGLHFISREKLSEFERDMRRAGCYMAKPGKVADSFSSSISSAQHYAAATSYQAFIHVTKHKSAKDLRGLYKAIPPVKQDTHHPVELESEHVFLAGSRLRIVRKQRETMPNGVIRIVYECEEI